MGDIARPDGGESAEALSFDEILELLSQYQRREIIRHLRDTTGHVHPIDGVIDHLMDKERKRSGDVPDEDHLLSVLVHIHGPKLEAAGVVNYDVRNGEIRYFTNERVERVLGQLDALAGEL